MSVMLNFVLASVATVMLTDAAAESNELGVRRDNDCIVVRFRLGGSLNYHERCLSPTMLMLMKALRHLPTAAESIQLPLLIDNLRPTKTEQQLLSLAAEPDRQPDPRTSAVRSEVDGRSNQRKNDDDDDDPTMSGAVKRTMKKRRRCFFHAINCW